MRAGIFTLLLLACFLGGPLVPGHSVRAAEPVADSDLIRQKNQEVERLRRELETREKELQQLREENFRLRKDQEKQDRQLRKQEEQKASADLELLRAENERLKQAQERSDHPGSAAASELKPVTPIRSLSPLADGTVVEVNNLVGHFLAEPDAAAQRYSDRTFRVTGAVDRFDRAMVAREYSVLLLSPDRATTVKFKFNYVDLYRTVFPANDGRVLKARHKNGREATLLTAGQNITFEGKCHGLKDGTILFSRSELVP